MMFNNKVKSITIKTNDKKTHHLLANSNELAIPYHNENLAKFVEKYENK